MGKYVELVQTVIDRITFHAVPGGILEGFKAFYGPTEDVEGISDLPSVRLFIPTPSEAWSGTKGTFGLVVNVMVATARAQRVQDGTDVLEHTAALEKVMDAIETNVDGNVEFTFSGKLVKPIELSLHGQSANPISIMSEVSIAMERIPFARGTRR
jgi:hypothetical protein